MLAKNEILNFQTMYAMKRFIITSLITFLYINAVFASTEINPNNENENATSGIDLTTNEINPHLAPKGYRGFVEISPSNFLNIKTTHGYQYKHSLFVGGGIGYIDNFNLNDRCLFVPIYLSIQSNVGKRLAQFTYGGKLGFIGYHQYEYLDPSGYEKLSTGIGFTGIYMQLNLGLRLGFSPNFALSIKPEVDIIVPWLPMFLPGINISFEF